MAFAMATVVAERYPNWPVRILSFGIATTVGLARVANDGHWSSDVILGAAMGTAAMSAVISGGMNIVRETRGVMHDDAGRIADEIAKRIARR